MMHYQNTNKNSQVEILSKPYMIHAKVNLRDLQKLSSKAMRLFPKRG